MWIISNRWRRKFVSNDANWLSKHYKYHLWLLPFSVLSKYQLSRMHDVQAGAPGYTHSDASNLTTAYSVCTRTHMHAYVSYAYTSMIRTYTWSCGNISYICQCVAIRPVMRSTLCEYSGHAVHDTTCPPCTRANPRLLARALGGTPCRALCAYFDESYPRMSRPKSYPCLVIIDLLSFLFVMIILYLVSFFVYCL